MGRRGIRRNCGLIYTYDDRREAAFDIHTSWVTPDNFPGYVEQEVQFRFDNGVWNGHSRKRGVECTVEGRTPLERKITMNNHYNGTFLEPWQRALAARLRHRGAGAVRARGGDGRIRRTGRVARWPRCKRLRDRPTMTSRPIGRPWPPCRRWKPFWPGMRPASPIASSKSTTPRGGLVLLRPRQERRAKFVRRRVSDATIPVQGAD